MTETVVRPQYISPEGLGPDDQAYIDYVMENISQAPAAFDIALRGMITQETTFDKGRVANPINFSEHRPKPTLPLSPRDLMLDIFARRYDRDIEFDAATEAAIDKHPLYLGMLRLRKEHSDRQRTTAGQMNHGERANPKGEAYGTATRLARFAIFAQQMQLRRTVPEPRYGNQQSSAA